MNCRIGLALAAFSLNAARVLAADTLSCQLDGSYAYIYSGTSYGESGAFSFAETGSFKIDPDGTVSGAGEITFYSANFAGTGHPIWLLVHEVQSNGSVAPNADDVCTGALSFFATGTVTKSSNPAMVPVGSFLYHNSPRSIVYSIGGPKWGVVHVNSTSPGTLASGTANRRGLSD